MDLIVRFRADVAGSRSRSVTSGKITNCNRRL